MSEWQVINGDSLDVLKQLPDACIDSLVTDPPAGIGFMGKSWDRYRVDLPSQDFLNWFAGFTDGEGCFSVHKKKHDGTLDTYDCQFSLGLRRDDKPILLEIQRVLKIGTVADGKDDGDGKGGNPQARFCVSAKAHCLRLAEIFRAAPLRAKKALDFEIWLEALDAWISHKPGEWADMKDPRDRLMASRAYTEYGKHAGSPERRGFTSMIAPIFRESLRVLKPGAHGLVWALPRTSHWTATALEQAGFEVRDVITHHFGTGFPKSLNVSKAIDQARTEDEEPIRAVCRFVRAEMDLCGIKSHQLTEFFGQCNSRLIDHWAARDTDSQPSLPTLEQWARLKEILELADDMDAEVARLNIRKGERGDTWKAAEVVGEHAGPTPGLDGQRFEVVDKTIREPSDAAKQWAGFGTALKPATEHWILVRKPLSGTVAANVQEHGTGALNIDACRIGTTENLNGGVYAEDRRPRAMAPGGEARNAQPGEFTQPEGRWPANLVLSHTEWCEEVGTVKVKAAGSIGKDTAAAAAVPSNEVLGQDARPRGEWNAYGNGDGTETVTAWRCLPGCPVALLDAQSGILKSGSGQKSNRTAGAWAGGALRPQTQEHEGSKGGASRFFYVSKPSTKEREDGLAHLPKKSGGEIVDRTEDSAGINNPRAGAGRTAKGRANFHPTVKSIGLMSWLIKLISPPGGIVLDPFCGSGSTGVAAVLGGWSFLGIEKDPEYIPIAEGRIGHANGEAAALVETPVLALSSPALVPDLVLSPGALLCTVCHEPQFETTGGFVCQHGQRRSALDFGRLTHGPISLGDIAPAISRRFVVSCALRKRPAR